MKNAELAELLARKTDMPTRKAAETLRALEEILMDSVIHGDKIVMTGFGSFQAVSRAPRRWRNPKTGEMETLPETRGVLFSPSKSFKQKMQGEDHETEK